LIARMVVTMDVLAVVLALLIAAVALAFRYPA
jgi:hypothetical protein